MLETGTGPNFINKCIEYKENFSNFTKARQVKMVEKLGKINRLFLHSEEKSEYYTI